MYVIQTNPLHFKHSSSRSITVPKKIKSCASALELSATVFKSNERIVIIGNQLRTTILKLNWSEGSD